MRAPALFLIGAAIAFSISLPFSAQTQQPARTHATAGGDAAKTADEEYRQFDHLLSSLRTRNAKQYAINLAKGIEEASYVSIGGIEQWVTIRGEDRANPVLLLVAHVRPLAAGH